MIIVKKVKEMSYCVIFFTETLGRMVYKGGLRNNLRD